MGFTLQEIEKDVLKQYRGLLRDCQSHVPKEDMKVIREALNIVIKTGSERSETITGIPFVLYAISVARILAGEIGLGKTAIIGALLTEVIQETDLTEDDIEQKFGSEIVDIVKSLSKISEKEIRTTPDQADSYRKLILTLAGDIQVLLIKIAERLELMRNLEKTAKETQEKISSETGFLYSPLAHRLGLYNIKSELEDLSMKFLERDSYVLISAKLKETSQARNRFIREFTKPIKKRLDNESVVCEIKGRLKSVFSIWTKMKRQNVEFDEVYDLFALRIILKSKPENEKALCWHVYSIVTDFYTPNPERLRDWISIPKSNGYESLHTTVASPKGRWVEVQIRTERMNKIAEKGLAAHWKYKGSETDRFLDEWLQNMKEILESPEPETKDFVDQVKLSLYSDDIFVFTPRGDLKRLPKGATVLDFAFEIHSEVGAKCTGGKVNRKNVTIRHILRNGDLVEIITSKNQKPNIDWLKVVVTSKAKNKIRQALNEEKAKEAEIGKEILKRRLRNWKIGFNDANVKKLLKHYGLKYAQDLYYSISQEKIGLTAIKEYLTKEMAEKGISQLIPDSERPEQDRKLKPAVVEDFLIIDNQIENVDFKLSKCCNPLLGDKIFGFVTIKEGIKIHRMDCPNARQLLSKYPYRVIQTKWTLSDGSTFFSTTIRISGFDNIGIMNRISEVITNEMKVNMQSVNFSTKEGMFEGEIKLMIHDKKHLDILIRKLTELKGVLKVTRYSREGG